MFESGKKGNAAKKAYEIAYALFRISAKISEESVKNKIESYGIDFLTSVNAEEYGAAARALAAIDCLVKIAVDLNIMSIPNGEVLFREIGNMNEAIVECMDKSDDVDASKFFTQASEGKRRSAHFVASGQARNLDTVIPATSRPTMIPNPSRSTEVSAPAFPPVMFHENREPAFSPSVIPAKAISSHADPAPYTDAGKRNPGRNDLNPVLQRDDREEARGNIQSGNPANSLKSGNRQIAILDRIRQSGKCKLREIQEILPDCSERTIRYDLEELIERNLVERIGSGGPSISYKIRQVA